MRSLRIILLAGVLIFAWASQAVADEVTDQLDKVKSLYAAQKYAQAITELNFALGQIQEKLAEFYMKALPEPASGWQADEPESQTAVMALMGGGVAVKRHFYKGDETYVDVEIVSESPMLSSIMMMLGNPMFLGDNKLVIIKGEKAVEEWNGDEKSGSLQLVIENRIHVLVSGGSLEKKDDLYTYANAMDFAKLRALVKD